jgi:CDP-diacylglycerol--serine O-phosphatidyltransferase
LQKSMIKLLSLADVVSLTNAGFGFLAIIMASLGEMWFSFSFILIALLADGLDGMIARKTGHSELGDYMEAMADMISLGIAPSVFVYTIYHDAVSWCIYYHSYLLITLIVFLSLSIIRLASFHIMKDNKSFVGLPASVSAIIIIILAFFEIEVLYILPVVIIISLAMISNVHFPKPGLKIDAIAAILISLTLIFGKDYYGIAPLLLITTLVIYTMLGPLYLLKSK